MSITISNTDVTIDNQTVSFEDIYQAALATNKTQYVNKLGTSYLLKTNLKLQNNASVIDTNKFITIEGQYIQIPIGCTLKLGEKRSNGSTLNGCTLNAPNIFLSYGFGHTTITNSGNLLLYGSTVNIYGFWSFFKGDNWVEIIDCFVDGFGRISGGNSIMKNVIFKRSHGKYGVISTKGKIKTMENISSYDSTIFYDTYWSQNMKCSIYHNPEFAQNLDIMYGEYGGYDKLLYVEDTAGTWTTTLYGTKVLSGYDMFREANNHNFYHKYKFNPKIQLQDGGPVVNAVVTITNNKNEVEFTGNTDDNGYIDTWLTYYQNLKIINTGEITTPHVVNIVKDDTVFETTLFVNKNMDNFPLFLVSTGGTGGTGGCGCDEIDTKFSNLKADLMATLVPLHTKVDELNVKANTCVIA